VTDEEIAKVLAGENEDYKAAEEEHRNLKAMLVEFQSKVYLTPEEELEKKRLQKLKLAKKDQMAELIRGYKQAHSA